MNDREHEQIIRIAVHATATRKRALADGISRVFADHSAKGRLHSGATVKMSIEVMHKLADELLSDIGMKAKAISLDRVTFNLVAAAVTDFLNHYEKEQLPPVVKMASGRMQGQPDPSIVRAATSLFNVVRADIEAKLAIFEFDFGRASEAPIAEVIERPAVAMIPPSKKGGRPPAEFWDDMWAAIAAALYNGDLKPKSQADVERAMLEWIEDNGNSAVESTVRARARRLWDRLAALDS
jgi:hypothetical protein